MTENGLALAPPKCEELLLAGKKKCRPIKIFLYEEDIKITDKTKSTKVKSEHDY